MGVTEYLNDIVSIAEEYFIQAPLIVGGIARDYAMGLSPIKTDDVDLTTNTADSLRLGVLVADKYNVSFNIFEDGHIIVNFDNFNIDFSSNFISEDVVKFLNKKNTTIDKTDYEVYSRDFTINTLHQDIRTKEIIDPTGSGLDDLSSGLIKTPVPASISIADDPRRAFRAIYFAAKYDFEIDKEIIAYISNNHEIFSDGRVKDRFISMKINSSISASPDKTIKYLKEMNLLSRVPLTGFFKDYMIKNKMVIEYLDNEKRNR
jgi:tRNA nucleotidyltransferase/poly(A) polymerase